MHTIHFIAASRLIGYLQEVAAAIYIYITYNLP